MEERAEARAPDELPQAQQREEAGETNRHQGRRQGLEVKRQEGKRFVFKLSATRRQHSWLRR